jgi:hypothetical protein
MWPTIKDGTAGETERSTIKSPHRPGDGFHARLTTSVTAQIQSECHERPNVRLAFEADRDGELLLAPGVSKMAKQQLFKQALSGDPLCELLACLVAC